jgi:thiamine kinase-like enzyme
LAKELGEKLAKIHSFRPLINKSVHWITQTFTETNVNSYKKSEKWELIRQNCLNNLIENDFESEVNLLMNLISKCNSPIVFSHNDFGFNNILVKTQTENNNLEKSIVLSDFEFSSYGFRGRDFGLLFEDWLNYSNKTYDKSFEILIEPILKSYLSESIQIMGQNYKNNEINSLQHLIYESKVFLLLAKLFLVLFWLNADQTIFTQLSQIEIMVIQFILKNDSEPISNIYQTFFSQTEANKLFGNYLNLKQIMIEENIFQI